MCNVTRNAVFPKMRRTCSRRQWRGGSRVLFPLFIGFTCCKSVSFLGTLMRVLISNDDTTIPKELYTYWILCVTCHKLRWSSGALIWTNLCYVYYRWQYWQWISEYRSNISNKRVRFLEILIRNIISRKNSPNFLILDNPGQRVNIRTYPGKNGISSHLILRKMIKYLFIWTIIIDKFYKFLQDIVCMYRESGWMIK